MMATIKFISRGRGKVMLHNNKEYYKHTDYSKGDSLWRCINYKNIKCVGSLKISSDGNVLGTKPHSADCTRNENKIVARDVTSACIQEIIQGEDTAPAAYRKVASAYHENTPNISSNLPSWSSVSSTVYRKVNEHYGVYKLNCLETSELKIPNTFYDLVLADYEDEDSRILLFASKEAIEIIPNVKTFLFDGTFKVCPKPFVQLYTMHGDLGSSMEFTNIIPLIYVLLTSKNKKTYMTMLKLIKKRIPNFSPSEVITDFELAAIGAFRLVFPNAKIHGCYFHFTQALRRKAKKMQFRNNIFLDRIVSLCSALPLLPETMIENGWAYIKSETVGIEHPNVQHFIKYIESYWVNNDFHKAWCCFGIKHRTTNSVESWHHTFAGQFKRTPPSMLVFLKKMAADIALQKVIAKKILNCKTSKNSKTKRNNKNKYRDEFILENQLQLTLGEISVEMFLNKIIYLNRH